MGSQGKHWIAGKPCEPSQSLTVRLNLQIESSGICSKFWGNLDGGFATGGLAQKAPIGLKNGPSWEFLLSPRGCEVRRIWSRSAPKGPGRPRKSSDQPRKGPFFQEEFCPIFSKKLGGGCLTPLSGVAERSLEGLRSLVWQAVSSLMEIPTDSCYFFCTPGTVRPQ